MRYGSGFSLALCVKQQTFARVLIGSELNAMLTRQLQGIPGCAGCTVRVGPSIQVDDFEKCNWSYFEVTVVRGGLDARKVRAIAGAAVSDARELYNVVDDPSPSK